MTYSPPLVKLLEKEISKWTGTIFGILDVRLSVAVKEISFAGLDFYETSVQAHYICTEHLMVLNELISFKHNRPMFFTALSAGCQVAKTHLLVCLESITWISICFICVSGAFTLSLYVDNHYSE